MIYWLGKRTASIILSLFLSHYFDSIVRRVTWMSFPAGPRSGVPRPSTLAFRVNPISRRPCALWPVVWLPGSGMATPLAVFHPVGCIPSWIHALTSRVPPYLRPVRFGLSTRLVFCPPGPHYPLVTPLSTGGSGKATWMIVVSFSSLVMAAVVPMTRGFCESSGRGTVYRAAFQMSSPDAVPRGVFQKVVPAGFLGFSDCPSQIPARISYCTRGAALSSPRPSQDLTEFQYLCPPPLGA